MYNPQLYVINSNKPEGYPSSIASSVTKTNLLPALPKRLPLPPSRRVCIRPRSSDTDNRDTFPAQIAHEKTTIARPSLHAKNQGPLLTELDPLSAVLFTDPSILPDNNATMQNMQWFNTDPLADINAFMNTTNAEMSDLGQADPIDWTEFLNDPELGSANDIAKTGNASPTSNVSSPRSSESEQSRALDIANDFGSDLDLDMALGLNGFDAVDFDMNLPAPGIMHSAEDLFNTMPDTGMQMQGVLPFGSGSGMNDLGALNDMTDINVADLGLADFIAKFAPTTALTAPAAPTIPAAASAQAPAINASDALQQAYASLGWSSPAPAQAAAMPTAVQPAQLSLTAVPSPLSTSLPVVPPLKRKESDAESDASAPAKRPRGRPPKPRADSASIVPSGLATPLVRAGSIESEDAETAIKRTASGKPSTARPKSVVPEKYFKDGTAQAITGMTMEQILAFPTFEELLKQVAPALREGAAEFGERIAENRDKAKDAAKKSREERKAKIETLEATVEGLEGKIRGMQGVLMALVRKGLLTASEVQAFM